MSYFSPPIVPRFFATTRRYLRSSLAGLLAGTCLTAVNTGAQPHPGVELSGAPDQAHDSIVHQLALQNERCDLNKRREAAILKRADQKIDQTMRALGYYHAEWQTAIVTEDACWRLRINITPGDPVMIASVNIELLGEAREDSEFIRFLEQPPLQAQTQLNHEAYESLKQALINLAQQRGYPQGHFKQRKLLVSRSENRAEISLIYDSGPRYRFGAIAFDETELNPDFLLGFAPFTDTTPFDVTLLSQFQQALLNSGYFSQVSVLQLTPDPEQLHIPIQVNATAAPQYSISLGLGVATDTGPRGSISFDNKRANRRGHQYQALLQLSEVKSSFELDYDIPLADPVRERAKFEFGWGEITTDTSESETWTFGVSKTAAISNRWLQTVQLFYQTEDFNIAGENKQTQMVVPGIGWRASHSDNPIYPTSGWRLQSSIRGAAEELASDLSFVQFHGSAKYIRGLGRGRILTRLEAGATLVNQFDDLPASFRFFAGGDSSIRGYDYEELGPTNEEGEVVGGRHLLTASLEYDYPVYRKYYLAAFYDAGNAFNNHDFAAKHSLGFGVRWRSPIGPIRLDFAFPLHDQQTFRLHLSMGPDL